MPDAIATSRGTDYGSEIKPVRKIRRVHKAHEESFVEQASTGFWRRPAMLENVEIAPSQTQTPDRQQLAGIIERTGCVTEKQSIRELSDGLKESFAEQASSGFWLRPPAEALENNDFAAHQATPFPNWEDPQLVDIFEAIECSGNADSNSAEQTALRVGEVQEDCQPATSFWSLPTEQELENGCFQVNQLPIWDDPLPADILVGVLLSSGSGAASATRTVLELDLVQEDSLAEHRRRRADLEPSRRFLRPPFAVRLKNLDLSEDGEVDGMPLSTRTYASSQPDGWHGSMSSACGDSISALRSVQPNSSCDAGISEQIFDSIEEINQAIDRIDENLSIEDRRILRVLLYTTLTSNFRRFHREVTELACQSPLSLARVGRSLNILLANSRAQVHIFSLPTESFLQLRNDEGSMAITISSTGAVSIGLDRHRVAKSGRTANDVFTWAKDELEKSLSYSKRIAATQHAENISANNMRFGCQSHPVYKSSGNLVAL